MQRKGGVRRLTDKMTEYEETKLILSFKLWA